MNHWEWMGVFYLAVALIAGVPNTLDRIRNPQYGTPIYEGATTLFLIVIGVALLLGWRP